MYILIYVYVYANKLQAHWHCDEIKCTLIHVALNTYFIYTTCMSVFESIQMGARNDDAYTCTYVGSQVWKCGRSLKYIYIYINTLYVCEGEIIWRWMWMNKWGYNNWLFMLQVLYLMLTIMEVNYSIRTGKLKLENRAKLNSWIN